LSKKDRTEFVRYVQTFREANDMVQADMAKRLRVTLAYYGNIEQGRRGVSQNIANKLFRLCAKTDEEKNRLLNLMNINNYKVYIDNKNKNKVYRKAQVVSLTWEKVK